MDSSSQVTVLQKDVQQLEQMNGSLLDQVAHLERELALARSRACEAESQIQVVSAERDELRNQLAQVSQEPTCLQRKDTREDDLRSAFIEIERFESLFRSEAERRAELEAQLASRQKHDIENGLSHSLEVSELERMNTLLAAENASLQDKIKKIQVTEPQPPLIYRSELSIRDGMDKRELDSTCVSIPGMEPCAEPEQEESNTARNDSMTQWYRKE